MKIVVNHGTLTEKELDYYIRCVTDKFPVGSIETIILDVDGDYVDVRYVLHRYRTLRKMGGYCIGAPEDWNEAKQAELRDTVPNWVE